MVLLLALYKCVIVSNNVLLKPRHSREFFELHVTSWIWFHLSALLVSQHCADSNSGRRNALRHSCVMTCTPRPASSTATTTWPTGKLAPPFVYAVLERCSNLMSQCNMWTDVHALFCLRMHVCFERLLQVADPPRRISAVCATHPAPWDKATWLLGHRCWVNVVNVWMSNHTSALRSSSHVIWSYFVRTFVNIDCINYL